MKPLAIYRHRRHRKLLGQQTHTLYELCQVHKGSECVDPRDKIFGLLGLSQSCCQEHVPADYRKRIFEVKEMLVRHHTLCHATESESRLSFEDINQHFDESNRNRDLLEKLAFLDSRLDEDVWPGPLSATIHKQKMGSTIVAISSIFRGYVKYPLFRETTIQQAARERVIVVESPVVMGDLVYILPETKQCIVLRQDGARMKLIELEWRYESCSSMLVQEPSPAVVMDVELFLDYDALCFICRNYHAAWRLIEE